MSGARPPGAKLRLGVMCQGPTLERWQAETIDRMIAGGDVELALVILDPAENYPRRSVWRKLRDVGGARLLFNVYLRTICRPTSRRPQDISHLFAGVPHISCIVERRGRWSQYFARSDVEEIRSHDLDMILRFGFNIIRGEVLSSARYGVWSFHHDDELKYRGGPPCFWEIHNRDPETGSVLQRLTDRLDGGIILKKGIFRTKSHSYSRNLDQAYFESAKWPAWVCRDLKNGTADYLDALPTPTEAPVHRAPTNGQFLRTCWIMLTEALRRAAFRYFQVQRWNVALVDIPIERLLDATSRELEQAPMRFLQQKDRHSFNADPFGTLGDEGAIILFEQLDYANGGRGRIVGAQLGKGGREGAFTVHGLPECHLSYPYLYREDGETYLIPETNELRKVSLYKAADYPAKWVKVCDLLEGERFVDPTLLRHEGRYWLFYTIIGNGWDGDLHLHLAYADQLTGPFRPHPRNPIKTSARSARPAGTPFLASDGRLIRPAQNFCRSYGGSTVLNEVLRLDPQGYDEREIGEITPFHPDYPDGLHTIARCGNKTLVDMKRHEFRFLRRFRPETRNG